VSIVPLNKKISGRRPGSLSRHCQCLTKCTLHAEGTPPAAAGRSKGYKLPAPNSAEIVKLSSAGCADAAQAPGGCDIARRFERPLTRHKSSDRRGRTGHIQVYDYDLAARIAQFHPGND